MPHDALPRALVTPFVRQRLVLLYARMGLLREARRHMETLDRLVDRPDPDVRERIEEASSALASAEGMAKSPTQ